MSATIAHELSSKARELKLARDPLSTRKMSSKWASDDDGQDDAGNGSPLTPNSPPSEHKDSGSGGGRRSRRPRPGQDDIDAAAAEKDRPPVKTVAGG